MRTWLMALALVAAAAQPAQKYFSDTRKIAVADPQKQNFIVVDPPVWERCRPDLGDIRLYTEAGEEVPFALREQTASSSTEETFAKVLQLGTTGGQTTFVLDMGSVAEYDRLTLRLDAQDFVATAAVDGMEQMKGGPVTRLGAFTIFDFTKEKLGRSSTIRLPRSAFRYLGVTLSAPLKPSQVLGASVADVQEKRASWSRIASQVSVEQRERTTVFHLQQAPHVPLDRLEFSSSDVNFRRPVQVRDATGRLVVSGEITRVRMTRGGKKVENEEMTLQVPSARSARFSVEIENGDDRPLQLRLQAWSLERRIYFDPRGQSTLRMFYGDEQVGAPVYDYAKLFQEDPGADRAQAETPAHNPAFVARADDRPWSERHPSVMWVALLVAVLGLAAYAFRSLRA